MSENQELRKENQDLFSVRDMLLRDQELVCKENERLLKKLEEVNTQEFVFVPFYSMATLINDITTILFGFMLILHIYVDKNFPMFILNL